MGNQVKKWPEILYPHVNNLPAQFNLHRTENAHPS